MRLKLLGIVAVLVLTLSPLYGVTPHQPSPVGDPGGTSPGGAGCWSECYTTCTGPAGVECCCFYHCSTGISYGCENKYCAGSDRGCL
jgi:hypothetical protein